jgi:hypothetical protein
MATVKLIDSYSKELVSYEQVTTWLDGSVMDDSKVDNVIYRKKDTEYYRRAFTAAIDITWFGAIANNSAINNTPFIQKAIDFVAHTGGTVDIPAGIFYVADPIKLKSNVKLTGNLSSTLKASPSGYSAVNRAMIIIIGCDYALIENLDFDMSATERTTQLKHGLFLNNSTYNVFNNLRFINFGVFNAPEEPEPDQTITGPVIALIAKNLLDTASYFDYPDVVLGPCSFNSFNEISAICSTNYNMEFAIRLYSNYKDKKAPDYFINKVEGNVFSQLRIIGDYPWNMLELAGGGTVSNIIENSYFKGKSLTAIDFDKGCKYNIAKSNFVEDLSLSPITAQLPFGEETIFFPIQNHGNPGYTSDNNSIINNKIINCGNSSLIDQREAAIGIGYVDNAIVSDNMIQGAKCHGFTLMPFCNNVIIDSNIVDTNNYGIRINPSSGTEFNGNNNNITLTNNFFNCTKDGIRLDNTADANQNIIIKNNNILSSAAGGIIIGASYKKVIVSSNIIETTADVKVYASGKQILITNNIFDGASTYSIRLTGTSEVEITHNLSLVTNIPVYSGSAVPISSRELFNSWQPSAVQSNSTATTITDLKNDINLLLAKLRSTGVLSD